MHAIEGSNEGIMHLQLPPYPPTDCPPCSPVATCTVVVTQMGAFTSALKSDTELVYVHGSSDTSYSDGSLLLFPQPTWAQRLCVRVSASLVTNQSEAMRAVSSECNGHGYCSPSGDCECNEGYSGEHCQDLETPPPCHFPPGDEYHFPEAKCMLSTERCPLNFFRDAADPACANCGFSEAYAICKKCPFGSSVDSRAASAGLDACSCNGGFYSNTSLLNSPCSKCKRSGSQAS